MLSEWGIAALCPAAERGAALGRFTPQADVRPVLHSTGSNFYLSQSQREGFRSSVW